MRGQQFFVQFETKVKRHGIEAPEIGRWYSNPNGSLFEVVAVDNDGTIEMQHFDGTLEEYGPEEWLAIRPEPAQAPEDWSGSVDISGEDLPGNKYTLMRDWQSEVELLEDDHSSFFDLE